MNTKISWSRQAGTNIPRPQKSRVASAACTTLLVALSAASSYATAVTVDLPAGTACSDFALSVTFGSAQIYREFKDKNGSVVRTLRAGKGAPLTFVNLGTGASLSVRPNGSVTRETFNPDGSTTYVLSGHNGLIWFPTDVPAGPSTTLYVGRVVYTVDTSGVFTMEGTSGKSTDVCAALAG